MNSPENSVAFGGPGIEPRWTTRKRMVSQKIEGLDRREDCEEIVYAAQRNGRNRIGCIILGRGEDDKKVREWLTTAVGVKGFIGFAVGRTDFWEPLVNFRAKKATRDAAAAEIARRYREFVGIFEKARA